MPPEQPTTTTASSAQASQGGGVDRQGVAASETPAAILLVDDRPANLLAYEAVLASLGHRLVRAGSGAEALTHLLREDFALVLLDVHMPDMDGFQTASLLQAHASVGRVPIIFVTASSRDVEQVVKGYSSGAVDFLYKPIEPDVLRSKARVFVELFQKTEQIKRQSALLLAHARERHALAAAQEAVRLRDDFLSIASHELNTPLTPIKLQLAMLRRDIDSAGCAKRIDGIEKEVNRFAELVARLLDVSRIAAGKLTLEPERVDLAVLLRSAVARAEPEAAKVGCALGLVEESPSAVGWFDPLRIEGVFSNLLSNALKYGNGHPIEVVLRAQDGVAHVRVRDGGIGIAPPWQARIFERFERVPSDGGSGGFGLGLWIARQVVEASGGRIGVESALGDGSTFSVELPLGEEAESWQQR
jgi:signal transduction histidine kinase